MRGTRSSALLLLVAALALSSAASAHDADIVYAAVERLPSGEVLERVTLTGPSLALLAPVDANGDGLLDQADLDRRRAALEAGVWDAMPLSSAGGPCTRDSTSARLRETYVELRATYHCPAGELRQTFQFLSVLPSNYKVVLGTYGDGGVSQRFAEGNAQTLFIPDPDPGSVPGAGGASGSASDRIRGFLGWVNLGVVHIFGGPDHLAFLLALLLVSGSWRRVLVLVTAFTVAHSITLGATALGWIPLDETAQKWVEAIIALSIVYVAIENLVMKQPRHRVLVVFLFGLIHGFGFASVLQSYGLEASAAVALLGFNLGVELGQTAVVIVVFPLILLARNRPRAREWIVRVCSVSILIAGGWWLSERLIG